MAICTIHKHSSEATATKCYQKTVGKRADKKLKYVVDVDEPFRYKQVKHEPPVTKQVGPIELTIFMSAERI